MPAQRKQQKTQHFSDIPELQALFIKVKEYQDKDGSCNRIALYRKIEKRARELKAEKEICHIRTVIAKYHLDHQQYRIALKIIFDTIPLAKKHEMYSRISNLYNWLAATYLFTGDYSNALDFFQMEIEHNIKSGIEQYCFNAYTNIGNIYIDIGDNEIAEKFLMNAKELAEKYPDFTDVRGLMAYLNTSIIELKLRLRKFEEAQQLCHETIEISKSIAPDSRLLTALYVFLSLIEYEACNYHQGIEFARQAQKHLAKNDFENAFGIARAKAMNHVKLGNKKQAAQSYRDVLKFVNKFACYTLYKVETLHQAAALFEFIKDKKDLVKVQKVLREMEVTYETLQTKMSLRAEQLIAFTNKYAPAFMRQKPDKLEVHAIGIIGKVSLPVEHIYACQTQQEKAGKNVSIVYVTNNKEYRVPSPLRSLFAMLNNENFVWINKNAFVNGKHIEHLIEAKHTGKITLYGKSFEVSRRKRELLLLEEIEV